MSDPTKAKLRMLEMGRGSLGKSFRGLNNYQYYVGGGGFLIMIIV